MEVFAPCPWWGSMPCAASPSSTIRPWCQRSSGRTVNRPHRNGLAAARIISVTAGCHPRNDATGTSSATWTTEPSAGQTAGLDDREEVDGFACAPDRVVQQVRVGTHPELDGVRIGKRRQALGGHDAAERAGARVDGVVGAGDPAAHGGAHAVRADHDIGALDAAVRELEHHAVALRHHVHQSTAQVQMLRAEGRGQDPLQVGAVQAVEGAPKPRA